MLSPTQMKVSTPELLWQGGGAENGKPDPVFSVDLLDDLLLTAGVDENIPPKGSVRLWKLGETDSALKFLVDLNDHQSTVNVVRFSPCGKMIAAASDRQIIVYTLSDPENETSSMTWHDLAEDPEKGAASLKRLWLRPCLQEIYDLEWSPDSLYVVAGSIDSKGEILRVLGRGNIMLRGHSSYIQGVAWDPLNEMVVTQSADRSCRVNKLKHKYKSNQMAKLSSKGHHSIRSSTPYGCAISAVADNATPAFTSSLVPQSEELTSKLSSNQTSHLYADSSIPCFFRRPSFSPDGSLLITPAGIHRPTESSAPSFCTHIYLRDHLNSPIVSLVGLEEPSVAVRCCPLLFETKNTAEGKLFNGAYRMIFAVVTASSALIYDTEHQYPLARIGGCHLAAINDAAWSGDGRTLVFCSSDGYLTFVRFAEGALGTALRSDQVPIEVKRTFPYVYHFDHVDSSPRKTSGGVKPPSPVSAVSADPVLRGEALTNSETADVISTTTVRAKNSSPDGDGAAVTGTSATVSSAEDKKKQKKRRIAPVTIAPLGDSGKNSGQSLPSSEWKPESSSPPSTAMSQSPKRPEEHAEAGPPTESVPKKAKKRIAPTLLNAL